MSESVSVELRRRRVDSGRTQRELASLSGIPQPNIAAYESGSRAPAPETLARLYDALNTPTLRTARAARSAIVAAAESRNLTDVRIFGSVARGESGVGSDLDLLVHPSPHASVFDLAGFMAEVEELLGVPVDVVSDRGSGPAMDRIRAEAVAL